MRSYEACEADGQLRDRVGAVRNATRAARRAAVAAPLPVLAVVYFGTHFERVHALRAYVHYFQRLVYMSPSKEIVRAVRELRGPASVHAHHCANTAARWVKATYLCVATVAATHLRGLRGALYLHFDLWLQARRELLATISPATCSPGLQILRQSCGKSALPARVSREAAPTPGAPRSAHLRSRPAADALVRKHLASVLDRHRRRAGRRWGR